jgi:hypothetical protein
MKGVHIMSLRLSLLGKAGRAGIPRFGLVHILLVQQIL